MRKVSVIIPVYNTGKYLEECLECMVNQTLSDIEIICVNDGSSDDSEEILERYVRKHSNFILINQNNLGQSAARNAALKVATGKYIYCMDSDDIFLTTALEELWNVSEKQELDVLFFSGTTFYESKELQEKRTDFKNQYLRTGKYEKACLGKDLLIELYKHGDFIVSPCLQFIKRELLVSNHIDFYEGIIHEDNLFGFQVLIKAERAFCINDIYFYRRVRDESVMTKKESSANLKGYYTCLINQIRLASEEEFSEEQKESVLRLLRGLLYHVKRLYNAIAPEEKKKFLDACSPLDRYMFEAILITDIEEVNSWKRKYNAAVKTDAQQVVMGIASIPRKLRTFLRVYKEQGFHGVAKIIKEKLK